MMSSCLYLYFIITLSVEIFGRVGTWEAFEYKKSNSRIRKQKKEYPTWRKLLGIYPLKDSFAPRHMKLFFFVRIANFAFTAIVLLCFVLLSLLHIDLLICHIVMLAQTAIVGVPFLVYVVFVIIYSEPGQKRITFDNFKNP